MHTGGRLVAGSHNRNEFVLINADENARVSSHFSSFLSHCNSSLILGLLAISIIGFSALFLENLCVFSSDIWLYTQIIHTFLFIFIFLPVGGL